MIRNNRYLSQYKTGPRSRKLNGEQFSPLQEYTSLAVETALLSKKKIQPSLCSLMKSGAVAEILQFAMRK